MSTDPAFARPGQSGGGGGTCSAVTGSPGGGAALLDVRCVEVLPLREGDRLIIHVDGSVGMSAGGGQRAGEIVAEILKLGQLGFDVPVLVVSPGFRVEIARAS